MSHSANLTSIRPTAMKHDSSGEEGTRISPNTSTYMSRQQEKNQLSGLNDRLASYIERVRILESENSRLQIQVRELQMTESKGKEEFQNQLQSMRRDFDHRLTCKREEVDNLYKARIEESSAAAVHWEMKYRDLLCSNNILMGEYQNLLDLKVQLDTELSAYHQLLEGEEIRLHIQSDQRTSQGETGTIPQKAGTKRKRTSTENYFAKSIKTSSGTDCSVEIAEVDSEGRFVQLVNTSPDSVAIGSWHIKYTGGNLEVKYMFQSKQTIDGNATITIWSNSSGKTHEPQKNLLMKNQAWSIGDAVRVELLDATNVLKAWRECTVEKGNFRNPANSY